MKKINNHNKIYQDKRCRFLNTLFGPPVLVSTQKIILSSTVMIGIKVFKNIEYNKY